MIRQELSAKSGDALRRARNDTGVSASHLRLRPVTEADEDVVLHAHEVLVGDGFKFAGGYGPEMAWRDYVALLDDQRRAQKLPPPLVPSTFLLADVGGVMVGRTSIRHVLNDHLLAIGGHIGYAVLPEFRLRGYATEILRQSLIIARSYGVARVLVTCDEGNIESARVIEKCGGVLENVVDNPEGPARKCRYWIE